MRRFRVWLDKGVPGNGPSYEEVELPDDATDEDCEQACIHCPDTMIGNLLDTGWEELDGDEPADPKAKRKKEPTR